MTASNYQPARFRSLLISFILFSSLFVGIVTLTPAVSADSGRTTGNEEITATVLSDYYERGSDISLVISANNLDSSTEYTLEYYLCYANLEWQDVCMSPVSNGGAGTGGFVKAFEGICVGYDPFAKKKKNLFNSIEDLPFQLFDIGKINV